MVVASIVFVSEMYNEAAEMGSHHIALGQMAEGTWVGGRAGPGVGTHEHFR